MKSDVRSYEYELYYSYMFRTLTFFFFLIVSVFGQAQQMGSKEFSDLSCEKESLLNPSVADQNPEHNDAASGANYSLGFFGTSEPTSAFIANDRWTVVGTYSLLFFSFILNVFLLLKLWNYRRRKLRMT